MKLHALILSLLVFLGIFVGSSCRKFVNVQPPIQNIIGDEAFGDSSTATSTVIGLYNRMMGSGSLQLMTGALTIYSGLYADELYNTTSANSASVFYENAIPASNSHLRDKFWNKPYNIIYHSNACIEGLTKAEHLNPSLRNKLLGEAKFIRAYCYFVLSGLFGDVPLVLSTDYRINQTMARTEVSSVYDQMVSDLEFARINLPSNHSAGQAARPTKWAAVALLARICLYQGKWAEAEAFASEVIDGGYFQLEQDLDRVFLLGSSEAIWTLSSTLVAQNNTAEGFLLIPPTATTRPTFPIDPSLYNDFEPGDQRRDNWIKATTISGQTYYYPFKYKARGSVSSPVLESLVAMRLAEVMLIRSEARIRQNNVLGPLGGLSDLNELRLRAGLLAISSATQEEAIEIVLHERRLELFCELGHRWFDLKRAGIADLVLSSKSGWNTTDILFPIPDAELEKNPFLVQNPGY